MATMREVKVEKERKEEGEEGNFHLVGFLFLIVVLYIMFKCFVYAHST